MYIHQNRDLVENIDEINHLLPQKRPGRRGKEGGMHSFECLQRHLVTNGEKSCWIWPSVEIKEDDIRNLLAVSIEVAIKFFFKHFVYNFGGQNYLQEDGGPIGARLTMAVARLVLQDWSEQFGQILKSCKIVELLKGIYVDDGRNVLSKLSNSMRFDPNTRTLNSCEKQEEKRLFVKP